MRNLIIYLATSLDGYIATKDEGIDWLLAVNGEGDNGYGDFYRSIDTVVMGRRTYDWIVEHEKQPPYQDKTRYLFTTRDDIEDKSVHIIRTVQELNAVKSQPGGNIWVVGGGDLINQLLTAGIADEIRLTVAPVILGEGIPLFGCLPEIKMTLYKTERYGQFVELCYRINQ